MGLTSDRVVLFVNTPEGSKYLKAQWLLASCPQRRDYQCFFMPTSLCALTADDIGSAYPLDRPQLRKLSEDEHKVCTVGFFRC